MWNNLYREYLNVIVKWVNVFNTTLTKDWIEDFLEYLKKSKWLAINTNLTYHNVKMWYGLLEFSWLNEKDFLIQKEKILQENENYHSPRDCWYFNLDWKWYLIVSMDKTWEYSISISDRVRFILPS